MKTDKFLELFPGRHIFMTQPETGSGIDSPPKHLADGLDAANWMLRNRNKYPWAVYFTVNLLDKNLDKGRERTKKMVTHARAIFMDDDRPLKEGTDDSAPVWRTEHRTDFPLTPSLIVNSSPGKYHYYWLIDGMTDELDVWDRVQTGLIIKYDGDRNAKDLARVLRLPGFYHNKDMDNRFLTKCITDEDAVAIYSWDMILDKFPPADKDAVITKSDGTVEGEKQTESEMDEVIRTAADGLHGTINKRMLGLKRDGADRDESVVFIQSMGLDVPEGERDARWVKYFSTDELIRSWIGASPKPEEDDGEDVDVDKLPIINDNYEVYKAPPMPPGLMGELVKSAKECARFQYDEVAIVTALGLVAGICGRKFNFTDKGLNIYMALIMDTGMGKDSISKFITRALNEANKNGKATSFIGPSRFTGPPSVYQALEKNRSIVCTFTEAGLMFNSKAGDQTGLQRVFLSYCNLSGRNSYTGAEAYSDAADSIKSLRAVAPTFISESTPGPLLKAFSDSQALEGGLIPRHLIFRVQKGKPHSSKDYHKKEINPICMKQINHLVDKCAVVQNTEDPMAWVLEAEESVRIDMEETDDKYVDIGNECRSTDKVRSIMSSRAFNTMTTIAGIASVFNHHDLIIKPAEWKWAKALVEFQMEGLGAFFEGSTGDTLSDVVRKYCVPKIVKILREEVTPVKSGLSRKDHKKGMFKQYEFNQSVKDNEYVTELAKLSGFKNLTGAQMALKYMEEHDMLTRKMVGRAKVYTITQTFEAICGDLKK